MFCPLAKTSQEPRRVPVIGLLVANGFLIALMLALAKEATAQGVPAIAYAFWQTLIAGSLLLIFSGEGSVLLDRSLIRYFVVSGLSGVAIPNAIAFMLVNKTGTGFTGIMYALPPIFTFLIATTLGLEKLNWSKLSGLLIAALACAWIILQRHANLGNVNILWYLLGIVIPVMLSIGNVYRSVAWPKGINSMSLAAGTLIAASIALGLIGSFTQITFVSSQFSTNALILMMMQGLLTALTYLCSFEVQKRSDPVFYSQLGTVAAIFGLGIGMIWLDESYSLSIWIGVFVVIMGLRMSNRKT